APTDANLDVLRTQLESRPAKPTARSTEYYPLSRDYAWHIAIEHFQPSDCFRLSRTECRDRSEDSSSNRIGRIHRRRVARLQLSPALESIDCAEAPQPDQTIFSRPVSAKT